MGNRRGLDELVDLALEESFPASDPPSFMAASAIVGSPRRPAGERSSDRGSSDAEPIANAIHKSEAR